MWSSALAPAPCGAKEKLSSAQIRVLKQVGTVGRVERLQLPLGDADVWNQDIQRCWPSGSRRGMARLRFYLVGQRLYGRHHCITCLQPSETASYTYDGPSSPKQQLPEVWHDKTRRSMGMFLSKVYSPTRHLRRRHQASQPCHCRGFGAAGSQIPVSYPISLPPLVLQTSETILRILSIVRTLHPLLIL